MRFVSFSGSGFGSLPSANYEKIARDPIAKPAFGRNFDDMEASTLLNRTRNGDFNASAD